MLKCVSLRVTSHYPEPPCIHATNVVTYYSYLRVDKHSTMSRNCTYCLPWTDSTKRFTVTGERFVNEVKIKQNDYIYKAKNTFRRLKYSSKSKPVDSAIKVNSTRNRHLHWNNRLWKVHELWFRINLSQYDITGPEGSILESYSGGIGRIVSC